jgi:beta-catenin-like protein 1
VALDEAISAMQAVAASPELYPELVALNVLPSLLSLVPHENTDISIAVTGLLHELLDSDELTGENEEQVSTPTHSCGLHP